MSKRFPDSVVLEQNSEGVSCFLCIGVFFEAKGANFFSACLHIISISMHIRPCTQIFPDWRLACSGDCVSTWPAPFWTRDYHRRWPLKRRWDPLGWIEKREWIMGRQIMLLTWSSRILISQTQWISSNKEHLQEVPPRLCLPHLLHLFSSLLSFLVVGPFTTPEKWYRWSSHLKSLLCIRYREFYCDIIILRSSGQFQYLQKSQPKEGRAYLRTLRTKFVWVVFSTSKSVNRVSSTRRNK
jgi:hypothetical protein